MRSIIKAGTSFEDGEIVALLDYDEYADDPPYLGEVWDVSAAELGISVAVINNFHMLYEFFCIYLTPCDE